MTLTEFEKLIADHDLTYEYSDDGGCWRAGSASLAHIKLAAANFPAETVAEIWNKYCDKKLIPEAAVRFYWRG